MRIRSNFHRFASFIVLKAPDTPFVLFEIGYLSNAADVSFTVVGHRTAQGRTDIVQCHSSPFRTADCVTLKGCVAKFASIC